MRELIVALTPYFRRFRHLKWRLALLFGFDAIIAVLVMFPPLFAMLIFDRALPERDSTMLWVALGGAFGSYLLYLAVASGGDYLNTKLDQELTSEVSADLFGACEKSELQASQQLTVGDVMVRLTDDTDVITGLLVNLPSNFLVSLLQLLIFFAIALLLDTRAALLGLVAIPLYAWQTLLYSRRLEEREQVLKEAEAKVVEGIQERLSNIRTIKAFCHEDEERRQIHELYASRARVAIRHRLTNIYHTFSQSTILQIWALLITAYLGFEVIWGRLTIGEMITLGIYLPLIQQPISDLAKLWVQLSSGRVSLRRHDEIKQLPKETNGTAYSDAIGNVELRGDIELQGLSFSYQGSQAVLEDINVVIPAKQMTALVGPSGVGKSTLAMLLMNFYRPTAGAIAIDGHLLHDLDVELLRRHIGVVFQEESLFTGTIRDNILYGNREASEGEMWQAAIRANADGFIQDLPHGYETLLQRGGENLSAGERKRIALARALLRKPHLLILDELTSSLDAESEFLIMDALEKLCSETTILMCTHQLSTARWADMILHLDHGHIIEQGDFAELMKQKGSFFDLYHMQMGNFREFRRRLDIEMERHVRYKEPVSLLILNPKELQTWKYKHPAQTLSLVMEEMVRFIRRHLRIIDFCAIYSGYQIAIALPQTDEAGAKQLLNRLLELLHQESFRVANHTFITSFDVGLSACAPEDQIYSEQLFQQAEIVQLPLQRS